MKLVGRNSVTRSETRTTEQKQGRQHSLQKPEFEGIGGRSSYLARPKEEDIVRSVELRTDDYPLRLRRLVSNPLRPWSVVKHTYEAPRTYKTKNTLSTRCLGVEHARSVSSSSSTAFCTFRLLLLPYLRSLKPVLMTTAARLLRPRPTFMRRCFCCDH